MKKFLLFILFITLFVVLDAQILLSSAEVSTINSELSAKEGDIYKDIENNVFYIGLSSGQLKIIGDFSKVNSTLSGDGSVANPIGIAQMGASSGQVLSWNGTNWAPTNSSSWSLTGNASTNPATNFLGTTDAQRLVFRTNNIERATFLPTGYFGVGLTNPEATFHNNGSTVNTVRTIPNKATGGDIETAANSVNIGTIFEVNQTTAAQTLTLPAPFPATAGRLVKVSNSGTTSFTMYGLLINPSKYAEFLWTGSSWIPSVGSNSGINKKVVLSAEYPGAVITPGSGSNHNGNLYGDNSGAIFPNYYMNYYEWMGRSSSGAQTYQVIVRVTLPNDFIEWQIANALQFENMSELGCSVKFDIYNVSNGASIYSGSPITNTSWTTTSLSNANLINWITPGQTVALVITFSAINSKFARIGDIVLNYK